MRTLVSADGSACVHARTPRQCEDFAPKAGTRVHNRAAVGKQMQTQDLVDVLAVLVSRLGDHRVVNNTALVIWDDREPACVHRHSEIGLEAGTTLGI